jgi:hypothetical protein
MKVKVLKPIGGHQVGGIIDHDKFHGGLDRVKELVKMGVVEPFDEGHPAPVDDKDAKGWKSRAESLEKENAELRTASPEAAHVARIKDLESEVAAVKAAHEETSAQLAELRTTAVPLAEHKQIRSELDQLKKLHETTVEELEKSKASEPDKK